MRLPPAESAASGGFLTVGLGRPVRGAWTAVQVGTS